jgi:hypothetical protein
MKRSEYLRQTAARLAPQRLADLRRREAIQRKCVAIAGEQLETNKSVLEEIGTTSTEEAVQSLATGVAASTGNTLDNIKWKRKEV